MIETRLKIAVFIDFDNIEIGVKTTLGSHFDAGAVLDPELLTALRARVAAGDADGAARLVSTLDLFAFSGTPAEVAGQANALFEAGARRVEFGSPHGLDEPEGVDLLAREVLPRLRE